MKYKKNEITIEATQTFSPGNVELLVYLLENLDSNSFEITLYLGHDSTYKLVNDLKISSLNIFKSSIAQTFIRSLQNRSNVLFFCSYPPLGKHKNSFVYYHSPFFANPYKFLKDDLPIKIKFIRIFTHWLIKIFHKKVDLFYCQTPEVKKELLQNFKNINVECKPFYNDADLLAAKNLEKNVVYDFFYPATASLHKNYFNLFESIKILGMIKKISIIVTVPYEKHDYIKKINDVNNYLGYEAIINVGRISKQEVLKWFSKIKAMIFPSFEESLGLPLIEAATLNIPIIGSDLPYLYDVVENPIVFDPNRPEDIAEKMRDFLEGKYDKMVQKNKINNQVVDILNYFK